MEVTERIKSFKTFCRENRYKITTERIEILRESCTMKGHFDADDLLIKMKRRHKKASRATVYRTLELLVEMRFLHRERLGGDQFIYECISRNETHYHCICTKCGAIEEFTSSKISAIVSQACQPLNFTPTHHNLKVFGLCFKCAQKAEEKPS